MHNNSNTEESKEICIIKLLNYFLIYMFIYSFSYIHRNGEDDGERKNSKREREKKNHHHHYYKDMYIRFSGVILHKIK